jgi:plastocyanin
MALGVASLAALALGGGGLGASANAEGAVHAIVPRSLRAAMDMGGTARTAQVTMPGQYYAPDHVSIVTGDTVTWKDLSQRHTVSSDAWSSRPLFYGDTFSRQFAQAGSYAYYCQVHPFMTGEVDVSDVLLDTPSLPTAPGRAYPIRGRTMLPAGTDVSIEADTGDGSGFQAVAATTVGSDGTFTATVRPATSETLRAVSGMATSSPVQLAVIDHQLTVVDTRRAGSDHLTVTVTPADAGATITLQLRLRERFGWWRIATSRLDARSQAHFVVRRDQATPARAALTLRDGWTQLGVSPTVRVGPQPRPR